MSSFLSFVKTSLSLISESLLNFLYPNERFCVSTVTDTRRNKDSWLIASILLANCCTVVIDVQKRS